ncbi:MAG: ABC transporter ATP-binding protein [Alphaproteobacteria bacterium]|nr:ABC transporter ATP-binding protein [Alphaproteobacteria bacterium]
MSSAARAGWTCAGGTSPAWRPTAPATRWPATIREAPLSPLLTVEGLTKRFPLSGIGAWIDRMRGRGAEVRAVDNVSFAIEAGETLGLVGESGCGKSTVARCVLRLVEPTSGAVRFGQQDIVGLDRRALRHMRPVMQMVFQDPTAALNPRLTVRQMIEEPLRLHTSLTVAERREQVADMLAAVGLGAELASRYAHELSGGQKQRVNIARAMVTRPQFVVLDEPTSALDVSLRSRIILLLEKLREDLGLSYLFISHDIATVKYLARRVAVMYLGTIVEQAPTRELFAGPRHPYTRALLSAVPIPDPDAHRERFVLSGEVPSPIATPSGCPLRTRCPLAQSACATPPPLREIAPDHWVACHMA